MGLRGRDYGLGLVVGFGVSINVRASDGIGVSPSDGLRFMLGLGGGDPCSLRDLHRNLQHCAVVDGEGGSSDC